MTHIDDALALPLFQTFTYRVPDATPGSTSVGSRVLVPFRNGREIGVVIGASEPRSGITYKDILSAPDDAPVMREPMLALCKWMAEYYVSPLGVVLRSALPAALTGANVPMPPRKTRRVVEIIADLPSLLERDRVFARSKQQRVLFELLESIGGRAAFDQTKTSD